ncbi:MAG TPA: class I SAM-dependent methyltransferase [Actinomycetales bacterium]|nr:class I SAM-dependent methyltransferase [Actinomycetales bacterium]
MIPSPNIWHHPATYEAENRGVDPDGVIDAAIGEIRTLDGADVVDIGCGSGFHLERLAATARSVVGVEPHAPLVDLARRRLAVLPASTSSRVEVRHGTAQRLPVPDAGVDVAQARWAYFFGPGCEPGLRELSRVVRRGGAAFVVDVDATRSTFGRWFARSLPRYDAAAVERFWSRHGWSRERLTIRWAPEDLASAVRIEFTPEQADLVLAEVSDDGRLATGVDYAVNLWWRRF